jgi:hypothetical protein
MAQNFSNIPSTKADNATVQAFDNYYSGPIELDATILAAIKGFFESRGFQEVASESIAVTIIRQANQDGYNPMEILDTLKGLSSVELSGLVAELLNYNRAKTSSLGYANPFVTNAEIKRNILDVYRPEPVYSLEASTTSVNEGLSVIFSIGARFVNDGHVLYWTITGTGIQGLDFGADIPPQGEIVINNGTGSITVTTYQDQLLEGNEIMTFSLRTGSVTGPIVATVNVTINDTSFSTFADYAVIEYTFLTGRDLDTRTGIVEPQLGTYLGWAKGNDVGDILIWSGDNTGTGTEACLFNIGIFKQLYPLVEQIIIDCRAYWYGVLSSDPVGLRVKLYTGGAMVKQGYNWVNNTASSEQTLEFNLKSIDEFTQDGTTLGQRIALFKYNPINGTGNIDPNDNTEYELI